MNQLAIRNHTSHDDNATQFYASATGRWWGCNWQAEFGPLKLRLQNVRARQALLIAEATSGAESAAWDEATRYLAQVEADAKAAERAAAEAISFARDDRWEKALAAIEVSLALESKYRPSITWRPLHDEIASRVT